jgi:hypothetical protein
MSHVSRLLLVEYDSDAANVILQRDMPDLFQDGKIDTIGKRTLLKVVSDLADDPIVEPGPNQREIDIRAGAMSSFCSRSIEHRLLHRGLKSEHPVNFCQCFVCETVIHAFSRSSSINRA